MLEFKTRMFLSNPRKSLLLVGIFGLLLQSCGSVPSRTNPGPTPGETGSRRFPFPTKEPDIYQGNLVLGDGVTERQYFVARKGDKWRFDIMKDGTPLTTQIRSDRVYSLDHVKKSYSVEAASDLTDFGTAHINALSSGFFRGADYLDYEETGREGDLVKYKARMRKDAKGEVLVTIDESTGMMIRQEITSLQDRTAQGSPVSYIYEVRNLRLDVDDTVFEIPANYKQADATKR